MASSDPHDSDFVSPSKEAKQRVTSRKGRSNHNHLKRLQKRALQKKARRRREQDEIKKKQEKKKQQEQADKGRAAFAEANSGLMLQTTFTKPGVPLGDTRGSYKKYTLIQEFKHLNDALLYLDTLVVTECGARDSTCNGLDLLKRPKYTKLSGDWSQVFECCYKNESCCPWKCIFRYEKKLKAKPYSISFKNDDSGQIEKHYHSEFHLFEGTPRIIKAELTEERAKLTNGAAAFITHLEKNPHTGLLLLLFILC